MATTRNLRIRLALITAFAVVLASTPGVELALPASAQPTSLEADEETFTSLVDAAERGAVDPELVPLLEAGRPMNLFTVLDGADAGKAYGSGTSRQVAAASAKLAERRQQILADMSIEVMQVYELIPLMLVRVDGADLALRLLNRRGVVGLTQDNKNRTWLSRSLGVIKQPQVAAGGLRGAGASVVVLDTGTDFTQPAFGPCTAPGAPYATCRIGAAFDVAPDDGSMDDNGHGTNVAGIVSGVAPAASVFSLDVFNGTDAWDHDILAGINWALKNLYNRRVKAVNMSIGHSGHHLTACGDIRSNPYQQPFWLLRQGGAVPVVSAGNEATINGAFVDGIAGLACTHGAVVVGAVYSGSFGPVASPDPSAPCLDATTSVGAVTCFSQDASLVDVYAPGALITAAGLTFLGTSQAAPHVSGAAAVIGAARPQSSADELQSFLTTSPTLPLDPRSGRLHPLLDMSAAVRAAFPVPNDQRTNARPLADIGGSLDQTTWTATKETGEPVHAGNQGGASVWFRWTATESGSVAFSTAGSDFNTLIAVYRNDPSFIPMAANDDFGGAPTSTVAVPASPGDQFLIAVDGFKAPTAGSFPASGRLHLSWNKANDHLAGALPLTPGTPVTGSNVGTTHQAGEPRHCGDPYAGASVWYRWTPPAGALVRVQAPGWFFKCVAVYQSTSTAAVPEFSDLTPVGARTDDGPDPIDFTFTALPGNRYWFAVDGVSYDYWCSQTTGQCLYRTHMGIFTLNVDY